MEMNKMASIFKKGAKKKPEAVVEYDEVEQGAETLPTLPLSGVEKLGEEIKKVLANQTTIVHNQQVILDRVVATETLIRELASVEEEGEEELTEEEVQAAVDAAKARKKVGGKK